MGPVINMTTRKNNDEIKQLQILITTKTRGGPFFKTMNNQNKKASDKTYIEEDYPVLH